MFIRLTNAKELLAQIEASGITDKDAVGLGMLKSVLSKHIQKNTASFKINDKAFASTKAALTKAATEKVTAKKVIKKQEVAPTKPASTVKKTVKTATKVGFTRVGQPKTTVTKTKRIKVTAPRKNTQRPKQK